MCRSYSGFLRDSKPKKLFSYILSFMVIVLNLTPIMSDFSIIMISTFASQADLNLHLSGTLKISRTVPFRTNAIFTIFSGDSTGKNLTVVFHLQRRLCRGLCQ